MIPKLPPNRPARPFVLAGVALVLVATPLAAAGAFAARGGIDDGDHVVFHVTVRDPEGRVLYTTDEALAVAERAAGNELLVPPEDASPFTYRPRAGFLSLGNGSGAFDHVPFLLGHREGDVVRTPLMASPVDARPTVALPALVAGVSPEFTVPVDDLDAYLANGTGGATFLYADAFPARVLHRNATEARVRVELAAGDVVDSRVLGVRLLVEAVGPEGLAFRPLLEEGDVFTTRPCGLALGIEPGRYRVASVNATSMVLDRFDARDALAVPLVSFEFHVLEVDDWPEVTRGAALAKLRARDAFTAMQAALPG